MALRSHCVLGILVHLIIIIMHTTEHRRQHIGETSRGVNKSLFGIFCSDCVANAVSFLGYFFIFFAIYGSVFVQLTKSSLGDRWSRGYICNSTYHHSQIRNINLSYCCHIPVVVCLRGGIYIFCQLFPTHTYVHICVCTYICIYCVHRLVFKGYHFVWRKHEDISPCTCSRINTNY